MRLHGRKRSKTLENELVKRGLSREIELNKYEKDYLFKGGSLAQKERNAFASSSDAFAKIGQAICLI